MACSPSIRCVGAGSLTAVVGKGKAAHKVIVAQGRFTIPAGKSETVSFGETAHAGSVLGTHPSKAIVGELTSNPSRREEDSAPGGVGSLPCSAVVRQLDGIPYPVDQCGSGDDRGWRPMGQ